MERMCHTTGWMAAEGTVEEVGFTAEIEGVTCEATANFKVFRPNATVTVTTDQVYLNHPDYRRKLASLWTRIIRRPSIRNCSYT